MSRLVRTNSVTRTEPCYVKPSVRSFNKRRCHGTKCNTQIPKEICDNVAIQADLAATFCCVFACSVDCARIDQQLTLVDLNRNALSIIFVKNGHVFHCKYKI